ncbi:MAG: hypothetical protein AB7V18_19600 [Pyrinomonadaceae bacterium]
MLVTVHTQSSATLHAALNNRAPSCCPPDGTGSGTQRLLGDQLDVHIDPSSQPVQERDDMSVLALTDLATIIFQIAVVILGDDVQVVVVKLEAIDI